MTEPARRLWLPIVVLVAGSVLSAIMWQAARRLAHENAQALLASEATHYADLLASRLESLEYSLMRMARRWAALDGTPPDVWVDDARALIGDYPAAAIMRRLNDSRVVRWEVTRAGEDVVLQGDAQLGPAEDRRLTAAQAQRDVGVGDVRLEGGRPSVALYAPLFVGPRFDGFIAATVDLRTLFAEVYRRAALANAVSIAFGDGQVLTFGEPVGDAPALLTGRSVAPLHELSFSIAIRPTAESLGDIGFDAARYALAIGLVITLLATVLAYQRTQIAARNRALLGAYDRLEEHERRYREMLRRANIGFAVVDPAGKVLEANEPCAAMLGLRKASQLTGRLVNDFLSQDDADLMKSYITGEKATAVLRQDLAVRRADGAPAVVGISGVTDVDPIGNARLLLLATDITERVNAQQEVGESKRIYQEVFETADVTISDIDLSGVFLQLQEWRGAGVQDLQQYLDQDPPRLLGLCRLARLNNMNQTGLRLFGVASVSSLQGMDYFAQGSLPGQVRDIAIAMWTGEASLRKEMTHSTFGGQDITVIYSLRLPATVVEARRVPLVTIDVTDVRSAESAKRANAAKTQFLASMSHEIRTPLNGVIGNLELLAQADLTHDQETLLFDAEKAAKTLLALIGNILDFSKIEAGKLSIEVAELNPAAIVQEAVDIVQSRARQKGIYITASIAPEVPQVVKADPTRIRQILLNLLGNAVKFTAAGGVHVNLRVHDWDDRICQLLFSVHDSGHGFRQSRAADLFLPFTQETRSAAADCEGTGLGLSICKRLVESFGGEIDCQSEPEQGASFWFTVPVQAVKAPAQLARADLAGRSALFVNVADDTVPAQLKTYLSARGARILTAPDDTAALAQARAASEAGGHIDVVIFVKEDAWPPAGFCAALRDYQAMPVVCIRGDASPAAWRHALRSGASFIVPDDIGEGFMDRNCDQVIHGTFRQNERQAGPVEEIDTRVLAGRHVLVLEDRLVNQTIVQRQLKKLGISCTVAGDGIVGLDKMATGRYDLVLCDCSMPEMNGYEFTRIVRQREIEKGDSRIPIIAMTANAFREDMEKCHAAGMDDFISKPVTLQRLASVISQWLSRAEKVQREHKAISGRVNGAVHALDLGVLQDLLGSSDRAIIVDVVQEFMASARESWAEIQGRVALGDAAGLTRAAHGAKGEARNAGAVALGELYEQLEHVAKKEAMNDAESLLSAIPAEIKRVQEFIDKYVAGMTT